MKKPIQIGEKLYQTKKDALLHYKTILNSYDFDEVLDDDDFNNLLDLIIYDEEFDERNSDEISFQPIDADNDNPLTENKIEEEEILIKNIKIAKVQFNTKCFKLVLDDSSSRHLSYTDLINQPLKDTDRYFRIACRNVVQADVTALKQQYFKDNTLGEGHVRCQETGDLCKWDSLVVDHRQPNTFSIIVDRFKEVFQIDSKAIEYTKNDTHLVIFKDEMLSEKFRNYHKEKANLRVVKKACNSSRSAMGRIKQNNKDLKIK